MSGFLRKRFYNKARDKIEILAKQFKLATSYLVLLIFPFVNKNFVLITRQGTKLKY
jgi:hypothetical protein